MVRDHCHVNRDRSHEKAFKVLEHLGTDPTENRTARRTHSSFRGDSVDLTLCYPNKHQLVVSQISRTQWGCHDEHPPSEAENRERVRKGRWLIAELVRAGNGILEGVKFDILSSVGRPQLTRSPVRLIDVESQINRRPWFLGRRSIGLPPRLSEPIAFVPDIAR